MITNEDIELATISANTLSDRGYVLDLVDGSPLDELNAACYNAVTDLKGIENTIDNVETAVKQSMAKGLDGEVLHDRLKEDLTELAVKTLSGILQVARTVINPLITECIDCMEAKERDLATPKMPFNIKMRYLPEVYTDSPLSDLVEKYRGAPRNSRIDHGLAKYEWPTEEELIPLLKTGITALDNQVKADVEGMESGALLEAFLELVYPAEAHRGANYSTTGWKASKEYRTVWQFLMCRKFANDPAMAGAVPLSTADAKLWFSRATSDLGSRIVNAINKSSQRMRNDSFLISMPGPRNYNKAIEVYGEVYTAWLKKGGSPELLMGAVMAGYPITTTGKMLLDEKETLLKRFKGLLEMKNLADQSNVYQELTAEVARFLTSVINRDDRFEDKTDYHARLKKLVTVHGFNATKEASDYARLIICKTLFPKKDVYNVLANIAGYCKTNPELEVREAATYASMDLVLDWIVSQIIVKRTT